MASQFSIPMREGFPKAFPVSVNAHLAMRALTVLQDHVDAESFAKTVELCWLAVWDPIHKDLEFIAERMVEGEVSFKDPETLMAIFERVVSREVAEKCVKRDEGVEKAVKATLAKNTTAAVEIGAFGLPWMDCRNGERREGFFGFDHMGQVVRFLDLDGERDVERSGSMVRALL